MAGPTRRSKPLKAKTLLADLTDFLIANPADGDLLIFNSATSLWQNTKTLTGNYTISGDLSLATLSASGLVALADSLTVAVALTVTGASSLQDTLAVGGAATLSSTLSVTDAVTLSDALSVTGTLSGAGFAFSGDGTVTGTLGVTGILTAGVVNPASMTVSGALAIGTTLSVAGISVFEDDVTINANLSAGAIAATSLSTSGNFSADNLIAGGSLTFGVTGVLSHDAINVTLANSITSGHQLFTGIQSDGSTVSTMLRLDPDDIAELFHLNVGTAKTATAATGGFFVNNTLTGAGYERVLTASDAASVSDGTVEDSILHWNNGTSNWDEMPEVTMNWVAGVLTMQVLDDGAVLQTVMTNDADGASILHHNGAPAYLTIADGGEVRPVLNANVKIRGANDSGTILGQIQFNNGTFGLIMHSLVNSNLVTLAGKDSSGVLHVMAQGDPDGAFSQYFDGTLEAVTKSGGFRIDDELEIDGFLNHDGLRVGLYGVTPAVQSAAYSRAATIVESRALLASASATVTNNNNVIAALIADLQSRGFIG